MRFHVWRKKENCKNVIKNHCCWTTQTDYEIVQFILVQIIHIFFFLKDEDCFKNFTNCKKKKKKKKT